MTVNEEIFRAYDIRGVAEQDLPSELCEKIGLALGTLGKQKGVSKFALGRDCRVSSERIAASIREGVLRSGVDVVDIGLVPTPLVYFAGQTLSSVDGGIMITGSHNPADYNGLKVVFGKETMHGDQVQQVKRLALSEPKLTPARGQSESQSVVDPYIEYVLANVKHPLPVDVAIDCGNGMAGAVAPQLFEALGCQVKMLFAELDGKFPNHHPDPTELKNLKSLQETVDKDSLTVGIGFDGDADRIGVVDKSGRVIFGDELMIIFSRQILKSHPNAKIISEVKASHRLYNDISQHGGVPVMWKTGHSLIKKKMKEENAPLAGEMSGHMFFNDRYFGYDDAIYAAARLLEILSDTNKTPAELISDVPHSFATPEIRVDCPDKVKFQVVEKATADFKGQGLQVTDIDGARVEFSDGWGLVRASNTQPVLVYRFESNTKEGLERIRQTIEATVSKYILAG